MPPPTMCQCWAHPRPWKRPWPWYRAQAELRVSLGRITVPTLYLWGDADATVGRIAAEGTAEFVTGPFQFQVLAGIGHFITDQLVEPVNAMMLAHLRAFPVR